MRLDTLVLDIMINDSEPINEDLALEQIDRSKIQQVIAEAATKELHRFHQLKRTYTTVRR